jgi:Fur family zinc uptake transcriptional regulator/Fur family ferric uptake transcriptional regulator
MDRQQGSDILRRLRLRVTPKRLEVICCLAEEPSFLSAEEVWQRLKSGHTPIGLPTVYRILDELAGAGVVTRIFMSDRKQYYFLCPNQEHHHHFVCERCRRVQDVDRCGLDGLMDEIAQRSGGRVTSHILQLNGICGACIAAGEQRHDA